MSRRTTRGSLRDEVIDVAPPRRHHKIWRGRVTTVFVRQVIMPGPKILSSVGPACIR